jgi:hypothetical protein
MTPAEIVALRNLEAAEEAVNRAVTTREAARAQLKAVTRRQRRGGSAHTHLRLVRPSSTTTEPTSQEPEQRPWPSTRIDTG